VRTLYREQALLPAPYKDFHVIQPLLSVQQAAPYLGLAVQTIYNRISAKGDLPPFVKNGRLPQFLPEDIDAWRKAKRKTVPEPGRESAPEPASAADPSDAAKAPPRRGRPTKAEQIRNREAAASGRPSR